MRIDSSSIQLVGQRSYTEQTVTRESLRAWVGDRRPNFEDDNSTAVTRSRADILSISAEARARYLEAAADDAEKVQKTLAEDAESDEPTDPKTLLLKLIIERFTGHKIEIMTAKDLKGDVKPLDLPNPDQSAKAAASVRAGYGVEYDLHRTYSESETTTFAASGVIKTADGQEIRFKLDLTMSRQFASQEDISVRLGDAVRKDPLVVNFNGNAAALTDTKFNFDIDADGKQDQVSFAGPGSGFLALDRNGDGVINNGSELFGTKTGDGFAELAAFDGDHNGWIDEADGVYKDLQIWSRDAQSTDSLVGLKSSGVGAIYLGNVGTLFDVKDSQNVTKGQVKSTGIYLGENGTVGTIQQVDLAVSAGTVPVSHSALETETVPAESDPTVRQDVAPEPSLGETSQIAATGIGPSTPPLV